MTTSQLIFGVFPYVAVVLAVCVTIYRYLSQRFTFSSLSSQFLESKKLFWGSVPFHYGIIVIMMGHLIGFLIPRAVLAWNGVPLRLFILETSALVFGFLTLWGVIALIYRRYTDARVRVVTSSMDIVLLAVLLGQVAVGVGIAISLRWGSSWYASVLVPYLWSLFHLSPRVDLVENLHWMIKLHVFGGFLIVGLIPFTRLVHFLSFPFGYFFRPHQVVIWNKRNLS